MSQKVKIVESWFGARFWVIHHGKKVSRKFLKRRGARYFQEGYIAGLNTQQRQSEADGESQFVDGTIEPKFGFHCCTLPSGGREPCSMALDRCDCVGYVFEGLEDLPPEQLPQQRVVWVYTRWRTSHNARYICYPPPAPKLHFCYERREAYAMRFRAEE